VQRRRAGTRAALEGGVQVDGPGLAGWAARAASRPGGRVFVQPSAPPARLVAVLDILHPLEVTLLGDPGSGGCAEGLVVRPVSDRPGAAPSPADAAAACRQADPGIPTPPGAAGGRRRR
jgi:hypothetical protein